ncbi:ParB/Srx family N-terminal domain-containing protein [Xanthomonas oryzae pv. oryzicola]|uniref:ParB/Srx family N-terminal domain-containing protein n=1 Tax=Xanthomonas oryzae TaxID=347 RepID=UPI00069ED4DE|nr:ParB/Srx family N-terminal domain-containing protein [Xanthomonas oryzae]
MAYKTITVGINKLLLDKTNARHDAMDNEPEIIAQLLKKEKAGEVARSIAEVGSLNPLERIGVVAHPVIRGSYVVIEGNRRVCALKMLNDPDKAPESYKRKVQDFKSRGQPVPSRIEVVQFDTEEEAEKWISMRHRGEDGGKGLRPWNVASKARHAEKVGGATVNQLAAGLVEYAVSAGLITADEHQDVPVTTLTRYLGNPIVRHTLGLASGKEAELDVPQAEFDSVLKVFIRDSLPKSVTGVEPRVHSRSKAADWRAYANELTADGTAPKTRLAKAVPLKTQRSGGTKAAQRPANPDKRSKVVSSDFRYSFASDSILSRLYRELLSIDANEHSFAAAYLLRAFVERLVKQYAKRHNLGFEGDLHNVIDRCVQHVNAHPPIADAKQLRSALQPLRGMVADRYSRTSPDSLGSWVHGSSIPTRAEINRRWDTLGPGLHLLAKGL